MTNKMPLLSELCRPKRLADLNLPDKDIAYLTSMVRHKGQIKNLLLHGKPGVGKTSAALILTQEMDDSAILLDSRSFTNRTSFKDFVERAASTFSFDGNYKTFIINEADSLTRGNQVYLLDAIERFAKSARFILTTNHPHKLVEALRSRLTQICFDVKPSDKADIIDKMVERYRVVLEDHHVPLDVELIRSIVTMYFPDLRATANMLEREIMSEVDPA